MVTASDRLSRSTTVYHGGNDPVHREARPGSRSCKGPSGATGDASSITASAVPTVITATTAEVASSTRRTWVPAIPSIPKVTPSAVSAFHIALDDLTTATAVAPKATTQRDENEDQRA